MCADQRFGKTAVAESGTRMSGREPAVAAQVRLATREEEEAQAVALAERLGLPYVDVSSFRVDPDLFRSLPVEWMLRYTFIPEKRTEKAMTVICADPTDVVKLDELELLTGLPLRIKVGSRAAITDILQKSESSPRDFIASSSCSRFASRSSRVRPASSAVLTPLSSTVAMRCERCSSATRRTLRARFSPS